MRTQQNPATAKRLRARRALHPGRYTLIVRGARLPMTLR